MSSVGNYQLPFLCSLFSIIQATLALLSSSIQAATITVLPSLSVEPTSIIQRNFTTNSLSPNATTAASIRTTTIDPTVLLTSYSSSAAQSLISSTYSYTKTWTQASEATVTPTVNITVNQSHYTAEPAIPTTVLIFKGLPSVEVVGSIAGVLGAILLILLAIIVWHLCVADVLPMGRRSSRVAPSDATDSVSDIL